MAQVTAPATETTAAKDLRLSDIGSSEVGGGGDSRNNGGGGEIGCGGGENNCKNNEICSGGGSEGQRAPSSAGVSDQSVD